MECFCDREGLVVKLYYDGEVALKRLQGDFLSYDDLACMERDIADTFDLIPWYDMTCLMNIVEWMLKENLVPVMEIVWPKA